MPCRISRIVEALEPSATLTMAAKAKQLKAEGHKVHDFSVGEPDFRTPEHICTAAVEALPPATPTTRKPAASRSCGERLLGSIRPNTV